MFQAVKTSSTFIENLLQKMTLHEKIGQMAQVEKNSITPQEVTEYSIGSVLSGGGGNPTLNTLQEWRKMVQSYLEAGLRTRLAIPVIYGVDAVHGHNNLYGATIFPHNIGLGATRDPKLVEEIGKATAREMLACHVHWNFAPCLAVTKDSRWGRTYESFGNDPELVSILGEAYTRGLQSQGVAACIKHYVADGAAEWGSHRSVSWATFWEDNGGEWLIDQGDTNITEEELRRIHLAPYLKSLEAGALTVMASFSSWRGLKMHAHRYLMTDVLKGELGFKGLVVSDWMGINQLSPDLYTCIVMGVNAGLDMIMLPYNFRDFITTFVQAVERGDIKLDRLDDAVRRILWVKQQLGLFDSPLAPESFTKSVGSNEHRAIAREAVQKSAVLLKNELSTLPIQSASHIHVAGIGADDIGLQCGGWTIEWQGKVGQNVVPGVTLWEALKSSLAESPTTLTYQPHGDFSSLPRADVGIVVVSEQPYAEGVGDKTTLCLSEEEIALVRRVRNTSERLVLVVYSGRPIDLSAVAPLCDSIVATWLIGTEGDGLADILLGHVPFSGVSSLAWTL